ncbi:hypothetical protein HY523_01420 [Candidatus Berkelbacteria bacterium]|nr:hypothetical protein [Candidatus Berkelbacteria bacterium]
MMTWALLLIVSVAGMFVLLVRRLPSALKEVKGASVTDETTPKVAMSAPTGRQRAMKLQSEDHTVTPVIQVEPIPRELSASSGEKPVRHGPSDVAFLEERAEAAFRDRDFGQAKTMYETLVGIDNRQPKWYNRLGIVCLELEEFRAARDAFRQALNFDQKVASRHVNLAMAEFALGHRVTAISHLRKAIALAPHVKRYHDLLEEMEG